MNKKSLGYIGLILFGPLTVVLFYSASDSDMTFSDFLQLTYIAYGFGLVTFIISAFFHFLIEKFQRSVKLSIIISEIIYLAVLIVYIAFFDEKNRSENLMWLPGLMIFLVIFSLPMALSISYGTGKIIDHFRGRENGVTS